MVPALRRILAAVVFASLAAPAHAQFGNYTWSQFFPDSPNNYVTNDTMYIEGLPIGFGYCDTYYETTAPSSGTFLVDVTTDGWVFGGGLGAYTIRNGEKTQICTSCTTTVALDVAAGDKFGFGLNANDFVYTYATYTNLRFVPQLVVQSVTPMLAYLEQDVVITGSVFDATTTVKIDGVAEPIVSWSPTQIVVRPDPHSPGRFDLSLSKGGMLSLVVPGGVAFLPALSATDPTLGAPFTLTVESWAPAPLILVFGSKSLVTPLPAGGAYYGLLIDPSQVFGLVPAGTAPTSLVFQLPDVPALSGTPFHCQALVLHGGTGGIASSFTNLHSGVLGYPTTSTIVTITKPQPAHNDSFGARLARINDINGDGVAELAIAAPDSGEAGTGAGSVRIYSGSSSALLLTVLSAGPGAGFGGGLSSIRDFDGDGASDLLVGSTGANLVTVHSSVTGARLRTIHAPNTAVAGLVDLDGDGVVEIAVGNGKFNASSVDVYSGATGAILRQHTAPGVDALGAAVSALGDADGDGVPDYGAGAPSNTCGSGALAYARVYSGATGAVLFTWTDNACTDFGTSLANAGDIDGDGRADVIVGAPALNGSIIGNLTGFARVYSGADGSVLHQFDGQPPEPSSIGGNPISQAFGWSVAGAGDVNGDGIPDLLVGVPSSYSGGDNQHPRGSVRVYSGAFGTLLYELKGASKGDWLGSSVVSLGDVDGDQLPDFASGAPYAVVGGMLSGKVVVFGAVPP